MKDIKQIRRKYDIITESNKSEANKLKALVHAGLFEESKIPVVKKIMTKDPGKATIAEHKFLVNLLESLIENFLSDNYEQLNERVDHMSKYDPRFKDNVTDKDMPVVIILKRKAIRVYPDNQKVALYYSQALDKYVTIPFGPNAGSLNEGRKRSFRFDNEEDNLRYATRTQTVTKKEKLTPEQEADFAARKKNIKLRMLAARKQKVDNPSISNMNRKTAKNWSEKLKADIAKIPTKQKTISKKVDLYKQAPSQLQSPEEYKNLQSSLSKNIASGDIDPFIGAAIKLGVRSGYKSTQRKAAKAAATTPAPTVTESFKQKLSAKKIKVQEEDISSGESWSRRGRGFLQGLFGEPVDAETRQKEIEAARESAMRKAPASAREMMKKPEVKDMLAKTDTSVATAQKAERKAADAVRDTPEFRQGEIAATVATAATGGAAAVKGWKALKSTKVGRKVRRFARGAGAAALGLASGLGAGGGGGGATAADKLPRAQAAEFSLKPTLDNAQQRSVSSGVDDPVAVRRQTAALYKTNESVMTTVRDVANNKLNESVINIDGTSVTINKIIANKIVETYDSLNTKNKKKMLNMMNESVDSFKKIVNFVARQ